MKQKFKESFKKIIDYSNAVDAELREDIDSLEKCRKYINTELDYFGIGYNPELTNTQTTLKANTVCDGLLSLFGIVKTNMDTVDDTYVTLKGGKKYNIKFDCTAYSSTIVYCITEDGTKIGLGYLYKGSYSCSGLDIIYEPIEDTNITIIVDTTVNIYAREGHLTITEIGRITTIDPVEHVNTNNGLEDTPVGHIISHMGTKAPKHYLICDGATYLITDYPYLAEHIRKEFGSYYYFGGSEEDGTFAVPDLRNEFLRGYHCGGEEQLSSEVGVHQDATEHLGATAAYGHWTMLGTQTTVINDSYSQNCDTESREGYYVYSDGSSGTTTSEYQTSYTSRPTNTSVLYCIKYQPTYYMNIYGMRTEKVLFEGSLVTGSATLADSVENYDQLEVDTCNTGDKAIKKNIISTNDIEYGLAQQFDGGINNSKTAEYNTFTFSFSDNKTFSIDWNGNGKNYIKIAKVIGISYGTTAEGTPPSGGSSCSCPTYTDEEVNTAIDEILISNEEGGTE